MPLDYNNIRAFYAECLKHYADTLLADPQGFGRMDAAFLKTAEFIYQRGLEDGQKLAQDADKRTEVYSRA